MLVLNILLEHKILFGSILGIILINLGCIIYLVIRERKMDKEEIDDMLEALSKSKPRKEDIAVKPIIEEPKENVIELQSVLEKMQKNLEATPEEVVSNFEQDQEEKSIISYQELVKTLKKEEPVQIEVKEQFKKEFSKPLLDSDIDVIDIDDDILVKQVEPKIEEETKEDVIEDIKDEIKEKIKEKKFKNTDFISPIYGKMDNNVEYPTVNLKKHRSTSIEEDINDLDLEVRKSRTRLEQTIDIEPLREEMKKNDEFLKSLKDFRSNL